MEHQYFNAGEAAAYLNISPECVEQRVKHNEIPFQNRGQRIVFSKNELDLWASRQIMKLSPEKLAAYHQESSHAISRAWMGVSLLEQMIQPHFIDPAMTAKTKASVLRELVALAESTGRLYQPADLLKNLETRETIDSTALAGGIALLHPRSREAYLFDSSFIVVGRTLQPIHFGAPDGQPTDLFFLICCQDEHLHLHVLARLCLLAQRTDLIAQIRSAPETESFFQAIIHAEKTVLTENQGTLPTAASGAEEEIA